MNRIAWTVLLVRFYRDFAEAVILPCLPAIAFTLQVPSKYVQLAVPFFLAGTLITKLLLIKGLAEKVGAKKVLMFFILITLAGTALDMVSNIYAIIGGRFLQGMGSGCITSIATYIIKKHSEKDFLPVWAKIDQFLVWTPFFATFLSGYIVMMLMWQFSFVALALLGVVSLMIAKLIIPDEAPEKIQQPWLSIKPFFTNRQYLSEILPLSTIYSGQGIIYTISPILFISVLGWQAHDYWIVTAFYTSGLFLGKYFIPKVRRRFSSHGVMLFCIISSIVMGAALIIMALWHYHFIQGILLLLAGYGLVQSMLTPMVRENITNIFPKAVVASNAFMGVTQSLVASLFAFIAANFFKATLLDLGLLLAIANSIGLVCYAIVGWGKSYN